MKNRRWLLTVTCFQLLTLSAFAGDYVVSGTVIRRPDCKSGFGLDFYVPPEGGMLPQCLAKTKKTKDIDLEALVGQKIKIRMAYGKKDGAKNGNAFLMVSLNPNAPDGTSYNSFSDRISNGVAALGSAAGMAGGPAPDTSIGAVQSPPVAVEPNRDSSSSSTSYATGVNGCITTFFDRSYYNFYSYRNGCGEKVNILFLTQDGHGGSMDLGPGAHGATGDTPENVKKIGPYEFYACPYHFVAVDGNGQRFTRPITLFKCAKAGY